MAAVLRKSLMASRGAGRRGAMPLVVAMASICRRHANSSVSFDDDDVADVALKAHLLERRVLG